ncbi:ABC transporter permease [Streptomyces sp. NPDC052043]|uniref:ABC transporter permease n=1 Tax=Streptomyces sp. NPDC052043 TaxID=3365684 RepID=UPI0037D4EAB6
MAATVDTATAAPPAPSRRRLTNGDPVLVSALSGLAILAIVLLVGPWLWPHDSNTVDLAEQLMPPSFAHPLGTDNLGRDMMARVLTGARTSLGAGLIVVVAGAVLGCSTGLLAGALGGYVDTALTWLTNSILCFPAIMLAMAVVMAYKPGVTAIVIGLAIHSFPWYMRTLRAEVLRISSLDFVKSTNAIGATRKRVLFRHILPHLISTIVLQMAAVFGAAVLSLAALGFLGMGAQPPTAELGSMITDGQQFFLTGQWWMAAFPGLVLLIAVTLTTIVADRARELLDPRGEFIAAD